MVVKYFAHQHPRKLIFFDGKEFCVYYGYYTIFYILVTPLFYFCYKLKLSPFYFIYFKSFCIHLSSKFIFLWVSKSISPLVKKSNFSSGPRVFMCYLVIFLLAGNASINGCFQEPFDILLVLAIHKMHSIIALKSAYDQFHGIALVLIIKPVSRQL